MPEYKVYVNAGIEIWDTVEAETEADARSMAYDLIPSGAYVYEHHIEVNHLDKETKAC